jgi:catechol 2,3-dioxygenase-like lactoylglutathione lyase family enzyme
MADLEVGGLHRTSSITKDARENVGLYAGLLGMGLLYRSMNFEDPSMYPTWRTPMVPAARVGRKS